MGRNIVIVVGASLIAAAILIVNHWTINTTADGLTAPARPNRWTGEIQLCAVDPKTLSGGDVWGGELAWLDELHGLAFIDL
jgi:hypothetical protein